MALSAVAATLLGFMVAALTILLTLGGRRLTMRFMESKLFGKTLGLFHVTAIYMAVTMITAIAGLFVDQAPATGKHLERHNLWLWVVIGFAVTATWRFLFSLSVLRDVADLVVSDHRKTTRETPGSGDRPSDAELTRGV